MTTFECDGTLITDPHYDDIIFSDSAIDYMVATAKDVPVVAGCDYSKPIGKVTEAKRTADGIEISMEIRDRRWANLIGISDLGPTVRVNEEHMDGETRVLDSVDFISCSPMPATPANVKWD